MYYITLFIGFILGVLPLGLGATLPIFVWFGSASMALLLSSISSLRFVVLSKLQQKAFHTLIFIAALLAGFGYGHWRLDFAMADRLTEASQKKDVRLTVRVIGVSDGEIETADSSINTSLAPLTDKVKPEQYNNMSSHWRQEVVVEPAVQGVPHKLLIGMSRGFNSKSNVKAPDMQAGQLWQIDVRLKPAHSLASPGAFDVEKWLLTRGIGATGTLLSAQLIADSSQDVGILQSAKDKIDRYRQQLRTTFKTISNKHSSASVGVLLGLLTGDRALIPAETTLLYQQMGISHLLAISGPHVVLAAGMFTWLFIKVLNFFPRTYLRMERTRWVLPVLLGAVVGYALLAGWQLPAQRTVLMVSIAALLKSIRVRWSFFNILCFSAFILVLFDPLSVLSAGFWLSFGAVLTLLLLAKSALMASGKECSNNQNKVHESTENHARLMDKLQRITLAFKAYVRLNFLLFVFLLPLVLMCFGQFSVLSPFVNIVTIPLFGFIIVPLNLLALLFWSIAPSIGYGLWSIQLNILDVFHQFLGSLLHLFPHVLQPFQLSFVGAIAACLVIVILLLPRAIAPRWLIIPCFIPILIPMRIQTPLTVQVLDVGQGLSILLQTKHHAMLYDTGGKLPTERFGMGEKVVLPNLYLRGIRHLDSIMLSHLDNDHSGGTDAIMAAMPVDLLRSSKAYPTVPTTLCHAGQSWQWDGVVFSVLAPWNSDTVLDPNTASDNDNSCVLLVSVPTHIPSKPISILLTGDAGALTEQMMLLLCERVNADILVLGHHGSRFSSTDDFLDAVNPKRVVVSAGFLNRYGHPAPNVIARVKQRNISIDSTVTGGTLTYYLGSKQGLTPERYRDKWLWLKRRDDF